MVLSILKRDGGGAEAGRMQAMSLDVTDAGLETFDKVGRANINAEVYLMVVSGQMIDLKSEGRTMQARVVNVSGGREFGAGRIGKLTIELEKP